MKQINFISPVSKEIKKEVRIWMIVSGMLALAVTLFISLSLFSWCYYYYLLQVHHKQATEDHSHCTLVLQTQKEKESLNNTRFERLALLKRYQKQPEYIATILRNCNQKIGTGALQSCTLSKQSMELSYKSPTITHAQKTITDLQTIPGISNLQLIALQRQNNEVVSTIRAKYVNS